MILAFLLDCVPPLPEPDALFAAALAASGGESALRSHHTMILRGVLRVPDQGIDAPIVECFRAPGDSFTVVDYAGVGRFESGVLDGVVWADDPTGGPRIKAGAERAEAARSADFYREIGRAHV